MRPWTVAIAATMAWNAATAATAGCDRGCLAGVMNTYLQALSVTIRQDCLSPATSGTPKMVCG